VLLTDSEGEGDGEENEYQLGSFVCDDEDMGFESEFMSSRGQREPRLTKQRKRIAILFHALEFDAILPLCRVSSPDLFFQCLPCYCSQYVLMVMWNS